MRLKKITGFLKNFFSSPYLLYHYGAKLLTHLIYHCKFSGFKEHIPKTGATILISNHISYVDGLIIHTASPRKVRFVIDEDIYKIPMVKYWMDYNGGIPIAPNRESVKKAIRQVSAALKQGDLICIFPEGSLTYTGNMTRFRFGIEWMLKETPVPVIPIALKGLWGSAFSRKQIKWRWLPRKLRRTVTAKCGPAIPPEHATINHLQRVVMELKNSIKD